MFITQESFTRRIPITEGRNEDFDKLKEFFKNVWAIENGSRRISHLIKLYDNVISFHNHNNDELLFSYPIEKVKHIDIIYNKISRQGLVRFELLDNNIDIVGRRFLNSLQQLDGKDHISTCILNSFYSNV